MESIEMRDFAPKPESTPDTTPRIHDAKPLEDGKPKGFWSKHIRVTLEEAACRDHFALERTFLAYVRTASAYAQVGVTMAQLFRLNITSDGSRTSLTLRIGKGLGATTEVIAITIILIGAYYFFRQQSSIVRGFAMSRGSDVLFMAVVTFALLTIVLVLLAAADQW